MTWRLVAGVAGRTVSSVSSARIRPYRTMPASGTEAASSACTTCPGSAFGCSASASAATPETTGVAEDVPQKITLWPATLGAALQPGAATSTHGPKFDQA